MIGRRFFNVTGQVVPYTDGEQDDWGDVQPEAGRPRTYRGRKEQRTGSERTDSGDVQMSDVVLYLPPNAVVTGHDKWKDADGTYEVVGPPTRHSPGPLSHVEVSLRHVSG